MQKGPKKIGLYQSPQAVGALAGPREIICSNLDRERFRLADPYDVFYIFAPDGFTPTA